MPIFLEQQIIKILLVLMPAYRFQTKTIAPALERLAALNHGAVWLGLAPYYRGDDKRRLDRLRQVAAARRGDEAVVARLDRGEARQRLAILPWSSKAGWRSSSRWMRTSPPWPDPPDGHLARHRPEAGMLLDATRRPRRPAAT